ncbi:MAG: SUMF1/EgtB/PvdO family nonheme iron enzyme, partial [Bacteroidia bacterium]
MRNLSLFFLSCFFYLNVDAQIVSKHKFFKTLPGVVPLEGEYLFIDELEISNSNWKEYLYWLKKNDTEDEYLEMLPDTTVWRNKLAYNVPYVEYYYQHPAYSDYPVVGVTYYQAQAYCTWRAARIMDVLELNGTVIDSIEVRLPTEKEWKQAARGNLAESAMFPWEEEGIRKSTGKKKHQGMILANIRRSPGVMGGISNKLNDGALITAPTGSYWPNSIGLYNMAGNVSEWVEEQKAMGSNWNGYPQEANLHLSPPVLSDTTRLSTLGFRCVLEIISFKKEQMSEALDLRAKDIQKQFVYLPFDSLRNNRSSDKPIYMAITETSNLMYNTFLSEDGSGAYTPNTKDWYKYTRYHHMQMYDWHSYYDNHPVVNITHQSALAYCNWLTNKYNGLEKRDFRKVVFRLPTESEWNYAAYGGRHGSMFPWGGPYLRNSRGCFVANFCPLEERYLFGHSGGTKETCNYLYNYPSDDYTVSRDKDGVEFLTHGDSYFPNDFGIYQMSGNAAEMIDKIGVSKGGSWNTTCDYFLQIESRESYTNSSS